jgi:serine/threonine-protein kinase RsbT
VSDQRRIPIAEDSDIVVARQAGRQMADRLGFTGSDPTLIATAISEVARNIVVYAVRGEIFIETIEKEGRRGICVVARDDGPGIPDIEQAMRDGFSTGRSLGLGLPGARRLMDEFEIESELGRGTTVTMRKWVRGR